MKTKENYTRQEAGFLSLVSVALKETPHTFQGNCAYYSIVNIDFEKKELVYDIQIDDHLLYYTLVGIAFAHKYTFIENF